MSLTNIENEHLAVKVKTAGAELISIIDKSNEEELLWQADPEIWGSHAPVLFPIVGRVKDFKYKHEGTTYEIPQHGIVRRNEACFVKEKSIEAVTIALESSEETKKAYPFDFLFEITYRLEGKSIFVDHKVSNRGQNNLYFSVGAHPGFNCLNHDYSDYYLEFEQAETLERWSVKSEGTIASKSEAYLNNEKIIPLHKDLFKNDAIVLKGAKSKWIALNNKHDDRTIQVDISDWSQLGLWAKPNAPYVCIEPWHGLADSEDFEGELKDKEGMIELGVGEQHLINYSIIL